MSPVSDHMASGLPQPVSHRADSGVQIASIGSGLHQPVSHRADSGLQIVSIGSGLHQPVSHHADSGLQISSTASGSRQPVSCGVGSAPLVEPPARGQRQDVAEVSLSSPDHTHPAGDDPTWTKLKYSFPRKLFSTLKREIFTPNNWVYFT